MKITKPQTWINKQTRLAWEAVISVAYDVCIKLLRLAVVGCGVGALLVLVLAFTTVDKGFSPGYAALFLLFACAGAIIAVFVRSETH